MLLVVLYLASFFSAATRLFSGEYVQFVDVLRKQAILPYFPPIQPNICVLCGMEIIGDEPRVLLSPNTCRHTTCYYGLGLFEEL